MIGTGELIVILCVVLLLFGGKKLPEFARNLGKGIREFKKAAQGEICEVDQETDQTENKNKSTD
jgi:sec-independent protein translocase protein TatA